MFVKVNLLLPVLEKIAWCIRKFSSDGILIVK